MATFNRFEDIIAWQKARSLAKCIYNISSKGEFRNNFDLKNQVNRSSGSVMDNIAEGFGRGGRKEFINFLGISNGSLEEVKSQLYRAYDRNYISNEELVKLLADANEVSKLIYSLLQHLKSTQMPGEKFRTDNIETTPQH